RSWMESIVHSLFFTPFPSVSSLHLCDVPMAPEPKKPVRTRKSRSTSAEGPNVNKRSSTKDKKSCKEKKADRSKSMKSMRTPRRKSAKENKEAEDKKKKEEKKDGKEKAKTQPEPPKKQPRKPSIPAAKTTPTKEKDKFESLPKVEEEPADNDISGE
ncbi:hypothetical protein PMAYCL1PPCAC_02545, partial [Pristionchus mayeri]